MLSANSTGENLLIPEVQRTSPPFLRSAPPSKVKSSGGVIIVDDVARKMRLTESEVRMMYREENLLDLGGVLISREKKEETLKALGGASDMKFDAVRVMLKRLGVKQPVPVLEALGFEIEWNRDRKESLVYRLKRGG